MANYIVNATAIEDVDTSVLIDAVARYMTAEEYPSVDGIAAILGIEKAEEVNG